jgi:hypothetical protein
MKLFKTFLEGAMQNLQQRTVQSPPECLMNLPYDRLQLVLHPWKDINLRMKDWDSMTGEVAMPCMMNSNAQVMPHIVEH